MSFSPVSGVEGASWRLAVVAKIKAAWSHVTGTEEHCF